MQLQYFRDERGVIKGWEKVEALRRGRESWAHDERVLGSNEFVESVLKESELCPLILSVP